MKNALNLLITSGYLTDDVRLSFDDTKNTSVAKFYIKNPCQVGHNRYGNDFYVVAYGNKAAECAKQLAKGKWCTITGKISTWNKSDNKTGTILPGVTIIASEVYFDTAPCEIESIDTADI